MSQQVANRDESRRSTQEQQLREAHEAQELVIQVTIVTLLCTLTILQDWTSLGPLKLPCVFSLHNRCVDITPKLLNE